MSDAQGDRRRGTSRAPETLVVPGPLSIRFACPAGCCDLRLLPPELLPHVAAQLDSVRDLLSLRLASRAMRTPAADAIQALCPGPGLELPPEAWRVFRRASRLRIDARISSRTDKLAFLELLRSLPARLTSLHLHNCWVLPDNLARRIASTAAASTLVELHLRPRISTEAADVLLRGLPSLRRLRLGVDSSADDGSTWCPAPPPRRF